MRSLFWLQLILVLLVPTLLSGCKNNVAHHDHGQEGEHSDEHAPNHDHGDHAEGPHGGHLLELEAGEEEYHAEWLHDDENGIVAVYLLGEDAKTPVSDPPEAVTIEVRSGNEPKTYELAATDEVKGVPARSAYVISDPALVTALEIVVEGEEPLLHVEIGQKPATAKFEKHEHDEHHHH